MHVTMGIKALCSQIAISILQSHMWTMVVFIIVLKNVS